MEQLRISFLMHETGVSVISIKERKKPQKNDLTRLWEMPFKKGQTLKERNKEKERMRSLGLRCSKDMKRILK